MEKDWNPSYIKWDKEGKYTAYFYVDKGSIMEYILNNEN